MSVMMMMIGIVAHFVLYIDSDAYVNTELCLQLLAALRHTKWFRVSALFCFCLYDCDCTLANCLKCYIF